VKFTESGTISITAHETNGEVEIIVSDTGIGISKEDQHRLFKPFVRIDSHLRTKTLGTGLGLYLTRKLITELLGGTVDVQSQPGKGSTFTLRLPKELKQ
jgi:signal transduction histidine kinase